MIIMSLITNPEALITVMVEDPALAIAANRVSLKVEGFPYNKSDPVFTITLLFAWKLASIKISGSDCNPYNSMRI